MVKGIIYFVVICVVIGLIGSAVISNLPVFPLAGRGFLMALKQGQYAKAYDLFTDEFKSQNDINSFIGFAQRSGLNKYESVKWVKDETSTDKKYGYIQGIVTTVDKRTIPIEMRFVMSESGRGWQLSSIFLLEPSQISPPEKVPSQAP